MLLVGFIPIIQKGIIKEKNKRKGLNKKKCYETLKKFNALMHKKNIFYYLSEGTALGIYRDGDLITWDDDIDVGIFVKDWERFKKEIVPEMYKLGYSFHQSSVKKELFYFLGNGIFMDVEIVGLHHNCISNLKEKECVKLIPHLKFTKKEWCGIIFNLPKESYYEFLYGHTWKTPIRNKKQE